MTTDRPRPAEDGSKGMPAGLRTAVKGWRRRAAAGEQAGTLTLPGRVLHVSVRGGDPRWPPLLLCNGIGARLELLQPFVDALDPRRAVIRFDVPGIGGSPEPVVPYSLWTSAPMLSDLLDELGYQQADVLGISWGGGLAQQFTLRYPARVRRLVLVATGTGALMIPGHPRVLRHMLTPRRHRDPGYAASIAGEIYGGSLRGDPSRVSEVLHAAGSPGPGRGYYFQLLAAAGWTSLPMLPLLRPPTLILAGDDDPLTPLANARIMHRLIPRSELHVYHGGHLDLITHPKPMATIVETFLNTPAETPDSSADGAPAAQADGHSRWRRGTRPRRRNAAESD
ncbi:MAG TPA: poly(3-hydroxyalkanoate) depolymerase [Streptosporangiaceae bacterium]